MSDYLFDKQGPADPEVAELEVLLRPLAYRPRPLPLPSKGRPRALWIATAGLALAAALAAIVLLRPPRVSWAITGHGRLPVGEWLDSGTERLRLEVGSIGTVDLEPGTRARIVESGAQHKLQLDHGTLAAKITAPPRQFAIQTPRTVVTDLGCAFTVTVDAAGAGTVIVTEGKVALSSGAGEVVVPAGSECALTAQGPGVPVPSQPAAPLQKQVPREPIQVAPEKPSKAMPEKVKKGPTGKPAKKGGKLTPKVAPAAPPPGHAPAPPANTPVHSPKTPATKSGPKNEPATGPDPGLKLKHDAFRDIDRTVPR